MTVKLAKTKIKNLQSQFQLLMLVALLVLPIFVLAQDNTNSKIAQDSNAIFAVDNLPQNGQSQELPPDIKAALKALPKNAKVPSVGPDRIPTMVIAGKSLGTVPERARRSGRSGKAGQPSDTAVDNALRATVLPKAAAVFRLTPNELQLRQVRQVQAGENAKNGSEATVVVYRQIRNGLEVVGGELAVIINQAGDVTTVSSTARGGQTVGATPDIGKAAARETALNYLNDSRPGAQISKISAGRLTYVLASRDYSLHLAYVHTITGTSNNEPFADRVYTDANSNQVAEVHPQIHTALNRQIYTANNSNNINGLPGTPRRFEGQAPSFDPSANVNYDLIGVTHNWYLNLFNRDSYDNNGTVMRSSVHFGVNLVNAFWTGNQLAFGDGDGWQSNNLAYSLDVTAHEVTHGMTQYTSGLIYQNESGALNEAWSDIFGAVVEARQTLGPNGYNANTWKIGEDVWTPNIPGDALRYMDNPTLDGSSRDFYPNRYQGQADNGGVHWNSGIANLAFKLLVTGGAHPQGQTNVLVNGIGIDKARQIFYRAGALYLLPNSNFEHARVTTARAAQDLYGLCNPEYVSVQRAWDAVGVPGVWECDGGGGGDVHFFTYGKATYDWHGAGCYDVAQSYNSAVSSLRFQMDAVPFEPNPGTSVARRIGFTFPNTNSPHTIVISRTAPHIQLGAPPSGADTTVSITGDLNQSATIRFHQNGGAQSLLGTIVMFRHGNGVIEYSAEYADKTRLRAYVSPDVVVDAYLNPGWHQTLRGLGGVFPATPDLLSRGGQAFTIDSLKTDIGSLNQFATSWACPSGQSLFEAPAAPSNQGAIQTIDANERAAAEQACEAAGVLRSETDRFEACVFDVVTGGEQFGQTMALHAGAVSTLQNQPPPQPGPNPCTTTTPTTPTTDFGTLKLPELNQSSRAIICNVETTNTDLVNTTLRTLFGNQPLR